MPGINYLQQYVRNRAALDPQGICIPASGWVADTNTWIYVDSTHFKIGGDGAGVDLTADFPAGTKLRCMQGGGYLYFYVASTAYATDTTITISGGTIANAAITDNDYSYLVSPLGMPGGGGTGPFVPTARQIIAGNGLSGGGDLTVDRTLTVSPLSTGGLIVDGTGVYIKKPASSGLTTDASGLYLLKPANSGLVVDATGVYMGTPTTLTVATSNSVTTTTHQHAITSSANPGAAASLLATTAGGLLTLTGLTVTGTITISGTFSDDLVPTTTDTYDLGSSTKLWNKGWLSELDAIVFAKNTITLLGGWFLVSKNAGELIAAAAAGDTSMDFGQAMTVNDFVLFRAAGQVEYVQITSLNAGTRYNVTRNLDGSGANAWPSGAPYCVLGYTGNGRIEMYAYDTAGVSKPSISIFEQGASYNAQTERLRIGDMYNAFGTGANHRYGIGVGDYAGGNYLSYNAESAAGFVMRAGGGDVLFDASGLTLQYAANTTYVGAAALKFYDTGLSVFLGKMYGRYYSGSTSRDLNILIDPTATHNSLNISAVADATHRGIVELTADGGGKTTVTMGISNGPGANDNYAWVANGILNVDGIYSSLPISGTYFETTSQSTPGTPSMGSGRIYAKSDQQLYFKNESNDEYQLSNLDPYAIVLTLRDDFITSAIDAYWTGWSTTPASSVVYNSRGTLLLATTSAGQNGVTCHLYDTFVLAAGNRTEAVIGGDSNNVEVGLRMDDATDNNYLELVVKCGVAPYTTMDCYLEVRTREGGGAVTTTQISSPMPGGKLFHLEIVCSTTSVFYLYVWQDAGSSFTTAYNAGSARAYTRHGVFVRATSANTRQMYCHRYATNF